MNAKVYQLIVRVVTIGLAMFVAYSVVAGAPFLVTVGAIVAALLLVFVLRHFTKEVMVDERVRRIEEKAAFAAYRMFTILAAALSLSIIFFRESLPAGLTTVPETLAYAICVLLLLDLGARYYYKGKL